MEVKTEKEPSGGSHEIRACVGAGQITLASLMLDKDGDGVSQERSLSCCEQVKTDNDGGDDEYMPRKLVIV